MTRIACLAWLVAGACGFVKKIPVAGDAGGDAEAPAATVALQLPKYLDLGSTATWQATVQGPASASVQYAWQVTPVGAATLAPGSASSALDATGMLTLSGTVVAGGSATSASTTLTVQGDAAGSATASILVAPFETFGFRAPFAQSMDTTLTAGRVLAFPFTMTAGQRVIALGLRAGSTTSVQLGIYGTSGAAPADLLVASPVFTTSPGETVVYLDAPLTLSAQPSYLAVAASSDLVVAVDSDSSHSVTEYATDLPIGGPLPSPFAPTTSFMGGPSNVFVIAIAP